MPSFAGVDFIDFDSQLNDEERLVRRTARFETGLEVAVRMLRERAALLVRLVEQSWRNPSAREFLEGELTSLRRAIRSIDDIVKP